MDLSSSYLRLEKNEFDHVDFSFSSRSELVITFSERPPLLVSVVILPGTF